MRKQRVGEGNELKSDEMSGIAGATIVTSTAARKFGRSRPISSFHCTMFRRRASAFSCAFSLVCSDRLWLALEVPSSMPFSPPSLLCCLCDGIVSGTRCESSVVGTAFFAWCSRTAPRAFLNSQMAMKVSRIEFSNRRPGIAEDDCEYAHHGMSDTSYISTLHPRCSP